jgi:hypothetical protein
VVIDRTAWNLVTSHLFQAKRLGTELKVIVTPLATRTNLVLNGIRISIVELDRISFPYKSQPF